MEPNYPQLRKFMGDVWVDNEIVDGKGKHPLGLWQKLHPQNQVLAHVEDVLRRLTSNQDIWFDLGRLSAKFKTEFSSTLSEIEWAVLLGDKDFVVTMEPFAPKKGPDLRVDRNGHSYFLEIRSVGPSESDRRFSGSSADIFRRLERVPSSYYVSIAFEPGFLAHSKELKAAVSTVVGTLTRLKHARTEKATLYYFSPSDTILNIGGDIEWQTIDYGNRKEWQRYERSEQSGFIARFVDLRKEREKTLVGTHTLSMRPDTSHLRLRGILQRKRTQLPKGSRGILVIDGSGWLTDEEAFLSSLYGDLVFHIPIGPYETQRGNARLSRTPTGFFGKSSRVSAVVWYSRNVSSDGPVEATSKVYPTNRADSDAIRLTLDELRCFGQIPDDLEKLAAEHMPNESAST